MNDINKKLISSGVPHDILEKLKEGLGNTFETELVSSGLKGAAEKIGIDPTHLPHIDFQNVENATQELMGKDIDGDGKTGMGEITENIQDAIKNSDLKNIQESTQKNIGGFVSKIKGFFSK